MALTLEKLIEAVRSRLNEATPAFFDDTKDITPWLNAAQRDLAKIGCIEKSQKADVVAGQQEYGKPDNCLFIKGLAYDNEPLHFVNLFRLRMIVGDITQDSGTPVVWYLWAEEFGIYPKSSSDLTDGLIIHFAGMAIDLVLPEDKSEIPDEHEDLLVTYALACACEKDNKDTKADRYWARYTIGKRQAEIDLKKRQSSRFPVIRDLEDELDLPWRPDRYWRSS